MRYFVCFIVFICFSGCLYSQTLENLETKSFYYDVNNYSLTPESMLLLAEFVEEVKLNPIEIVEIIGYVEKHGSETYNKIKSKRRMSSIKGVIDSAIVIHQYKPENIDYPPSFLYSYSDGYNWRRVDITFRKMPERLILPITSNQKINTTDQIQDINNNNSTNIIDKESNIDPKITKVSSEKVEDLVKNTDKSITATPEKIDEKISNPEKNKIIEAVKLAEEIEIQKLNNNIIILDSTQKDLNLNLKPDETGKISTIGKSREDIDKMVIREKSRESNGNRKTAHPEVGVRLSKIDVSNMENTIVLINLNIQFIGDVPIINSSSISEMNELVRFLQINNSIDAFIRGHVCCGDEMPLSKKRAKTVYLELIRRGINPERLRYQGFSNTIPAVYPEKTDLDRSKNRRVDVMFSRTNRSNDPVIPLLQINDTTSNDLNAIFSTDVNIPLELDKNGSLEYKTSGKTQDQIDQMLVREKSSGKSSKRDIQDMEKKLANINIENLTSSVSLVILGLQFNDIDPILDETSLKEMDDLFTFLNQNKQINAFIRGHVCCGDNLKLSKKRAKYVYQELVKRGINQERLRYQGFSNTLLLVNPERTELDRTKNKRVDIIFSVNK
jgi:outer membrane protein OmpA-like peptidoglycan-associated protein